MAEFVALGASCLDDLAVTRADAAQAEVRGFEVPAPQTAGRWLRRFTLGHIRQLAKATLRAQRNAFTAAGVEQVTLDFDSTYVFSRSRRRQGVDRTYKKGYAPAPAAVLRRRDRPGRARAGCGGAERVPPPASRASRMSRSLLKIDDGPSHYATSSFSHEGVTGWM